MFLGASEATDDHGLSNVVARLEEFAKKLSHLQGHSIKCSAREGESLAVVLRRCRLPMALSERQLMPLTAIPSARLRISSKTVDKKRSDSSNENPISLTWTPMKRRGAMSCIRELASCSGDVVIKHRLAD